MCTGTVADSSEDGNGRSYSLENYKFLDLLSDYCLFRRIAQ
jgi:hypothetical protein